MRDRLDSLSHFILHGRGFGLDETARLSFGGWKIVVFVLNTVNFDTFPFAPESYPAFLVDLGSNMSQRQLFATSVTSQDVIKIKVAAGVYLFDDELVHLDPTWINDLLRSILDHRLQDPDESSFWKEEIEKFTTKHNLHFGNLFNTHQTFCAGGTLTADYLRFLWREVADIQQPEVFERVLGTMQKHGVMFGSSLSEQGSVSIGMSARLFVPVRLQRHTTEEQLRTFSAQCKEWRRKLVVCILQSYVPPGFIGMFMARLLVLKGVKLGCAWSRGLSFEMGDNRVLLYLNPPGGKEAQIEVNVISPQHTGATEMEILENTITEVLDNFPGLSYYFDGGTSGTVMGTDAVLEQIATLREHLDIRLDKIDGALAEVAKSGRESLACVKCLQMLEYPYPHLVVVREHQSTSSIAERGQEKRVLGKALFESFYKHAQEAVKKEMRLQFLCPYDFSLVPCGPDGQGYRFTETRGWVKTVLPAVQVCVVLVATTCFDMTANNLTLLRWRGARSLGSLTTPQISLASRCGWLHQTVGDDIVVSHKRQPPPTRINSPSLILLGFFICRGPPGNEGAGSLLCHRGAEDGAVKEHVVCCISEREHDLRDGSTSLNGKHYFLSDADANSLICSQPARNSP